ncbi:fatty acid desaturase [Leptolyngbya sp. FACHB-36]|uniref:fatty acid desaturase n=1 Tax=Leptolyngbya sp. FACHB-36 TaxID=2692808 RepID=UPI0016812F44|nr:fatty acid desaturase [Leptolyngbya sp. FACHB-36]MBD2020716.1 fatty acid desaturase [Leptolyngbya sp. FACHB-36]
MTLSPVRPNDLSGASTEAHLQLKDILKTLPKECFQKNRRKAWSAALLTILMVGLGYAGIAIAPWFLLPIAWIFTGTALTGAFVVGHDCGHRSFAKRRWVNDLVGHLFMLPLIYPFHSWRILHNKHHSHTNKMDVDNAWQPIRPDAYEELGTLVQRAHQTLRGRFWWLASVIHWAGLHFNLEEFASKDRNKIKLSIAVVVGFAAIAFPLLIATTGLAGFVKFWLMPWLVYHFWMSTFTLVHHTAPEIGFQEPAEWNQVKAQLSGTVHCDYPAGVELLCHHINVHVPHHLSTAIPSYNLRLAHNSLRQNWGSSLYETRFSWSLMQTITDRCHIYHPEENYQSFRDFHKQS